MRRDFQTILDECLRALATGDSLEAVLARYPEHADELSPLLLTAQEVKRIPVARPRSHVQQAAWQRFLGEAIALERVRQRPAFTLWQPLRPLAMAASFLLVLFLAGGATVYAASRSQPDDPLYGVKLATEEARLWFAFDENDRAEILLSQAETRMSEMRKMLEQDKPVKGNVLAAMEKRMTRAANILNKRDAPAELVARANALSAGQEEMLIALQDRVSPGSSEKFTETLAMVHEVRIQLSQIGQTPRIEPESLEAGVGHFVGHVDSREEGAWIVAGQRVLVDEKTIVEGPAEAALGRVAQVTVVRQPDGGYQALTIAVPATLDLASSVRISGSVDRIEGNEIEVGGRMVTIGADTLREGRLREGSAIELTGESANKTFLAKMIHTTSPEEEQAAFAYEGTVRQMGPTEWIVGERTFQVTPSTPVDAGLITLKAGARARVDAVRQGTELVAKRIILLTSAESPQAVAVEGIFQGLDDGRWLVGGLQVVWKDSQPDVPQMGSLVRVVGVEKDQVIEATKVEPILPADKTGLVRLEGLMTQLSEDAWLVGPVRIRITADTKASEELIAGARAVVWAQGGQGDVLDALYVDVLDAQPLLAAEAPQLIPVEY